MCHMKWESLSDGTEEGIPNHCLDKQGPLEWLSGQTGQKAVQPGNQCSYLPLPAHIAYTNFQGIVQSARYGLRPAVPPSFFWTAVAIFLFYLFAGLDSFSTEGEEQRLQSFYPSLWLFTSIVDFSLSVACIFPINEDKFSVNSLVVFWVFGVFLFVCFGVVFFFVLQPQIKL